MSEGRNVKVRVNALFHRLKISKNIKFQTHITWKRRTPVPTQTRTRPKRARSPMSTATPPTRSPSSSTSTSSTTRPRRTTRTKMYAPLHADRNRRSHHPRGQDQKRGLRQVQRGGGAQQQPRGYHRPHPGKVITIPLTQCPDPNANVEVTFTCQSLEEGFAETGRYSWQQVAC